MTWGNWRLYKRPIYAVHSDFRNIDTRCFKDYFEPTAIIFRARNYQEAMKKAKKFWEEGQFGMGSITVKSEEAK